MKYRSFCTLLVILICTALTSSAFDSAPKIKAERDVLATTKSKKDSITILYNIFDLSDRKAQQEVAAEIYNVARRAGRQDVMLDIARLCSSSLTKESAYDSIIGAVKELDDSREKTETLLFLRMKKLASSAKYSTEAQRQAQMVNVMAQLDTEENSDQHLYNLYTVVQYLRNDVKGDLLTGSLDELIRLVNSDSFKLYALRNLIYTEAANIYTDVADQKKAVEADRFLLSVIEDLEHDYHAEGRVYRDYAVSEYVSLRRMMRNFAALSNSDINRINSRVMQLAEQDPDVAADIEKHPRYYAYYYSATKQYDKALPYIQKLLETEKSSMARRQLLGMLIEAARATGNQSVLMSALAQHNDILEYLNRTQASHKYKELQILYDVNKLKRRNLNLELEKQKHESERARTLMYWVMGAWIMCLIFICVICYYWRSHRKNVSQMVKMASLVAEERDRLKNAVYYDYAAAPDADFNEFPVSAGSPRRFKNAMKSMEHILNDVMYIASIGREVREKEIMTFKLSRLIDSVVERVRPMVADGVKFTVTGPEEDVSITTDRDCAEHVVFHMLRDAARYTKSGEINFNITTDPDAGLVKFVIADTGIPLEPGCEEMIFENFLDMEKLQQLKSPGMFLSRLAAFLLSSSLMSARKYKDGCKFTFIMPMEMK